MRRALLVAVALLASAAPARAATLLVAPSTFSPVERKLAITAQLTLPRQVGVQLATRSGRPVGWIVRPSRQRFLATTWNGRIAGKRVADGAYLVRLVIGSSELAREPLRIDATPPNLEHLRVGNGATSFAGDTPLLTTVSPNGDGFRDRATVRFKLREPATVTFEVTRTVKSPRPILSVTQSLQPGSHAYVWKPAPTLNPRTYLLRLTGVDRAGNTIAYGAPNGFVGRAPRGLVVRLQGIDAGLTRQSYVAGDLATLRVSTDAPAVTLRTFHAGPEQVVTYADNQFAGIEVPLPPQSVEWSSWSAPHTIQYRVPNVPSGLYYVQLTAADGRVGYAPFVVRPTQLGATGRVLVVLPTNTWEAYNFQDVNGDGYGDTWYAGAPQQTVDASRPYIARGVPPRFYRYDLPFLHWFYWSGKSAEFVADADFANIAAGEQLAKAYDLVVFEGHEEYVTQHQYDVIERFRDLGGNLMFLSANNFFWKIGVDGNVLRRAGQWRQNGRPEAALVGVQYRANDDGRRQGLFTVTDTNAAPWLWAGTGVATGGTFGQFVGGYGIEIDARAPSSPPGTTVVATIPDLFGTGVSAEMTYYETTAGAKVFAAGALDFGGSSTTWPVKRMLENLWTRLAAP